MTVLNVATPASSAAPPTGDPLDIPEFLLRVRSVRPLDEAA
jgi:hypothetical protein